MKIRTNFRLGNVFPFSLILVLLFFSPVDAADMFKEAGAAYRNGDYDTAVEKFREVAGKGDHRAMYALGSMYAGGTGVEQDYRQAFKWFSEAAKYGRLDAQYKLGLMYELGVGVKQDYRRAARYYQKVGRQGYAHGQFKLGQLYLTGNGVKQDPVKAYAWMTVAGQNFINTMPEQRPDGTDASDNQAENELQSTDLFATLHLKLIDEQLGILRNNLSDRQLTEADRLIGQYITYR